MEKLSIEEKAKRYDDAIERARRYYDEYKTRDNILYVEDMEDIFPELKESEDDRIRTFLHHTFTAQYLCKDKLGKWHGEPVVNILAWLEKQGEKGINGNEKEIPDSEQKPAQEINPFEAEHGKYYFCIKDYFCGGRKQASKGDVVQALRGLPIMGLKDASEYFLPVNFIKCNSTWSEEDKKMLDTVIEDIIKLARPKVCYYKDVEWLKSLKERYTWKPSKEQIMALRWVLNHIPYDSHKEEISELLEQLKKLREE